MFDDLLAANEVYRSEFHDTGLRGKAARGLAVLTCIDSRIDPLAMLGLAPGDAKIIRNAGARVAPDALRSVVLAVNLLEVNRVCVVQHTDCAMASSTNEQMQQRVTAASGVDAGDWDFQVVGDQLETLRADVELIRSCPLVPSSVEVAGFIFDVHTGALNPAVA